ncbi:hypothetical protein KKH3_02380 [Pectobacterium actinidiae]|nr:hypothetical protein KKH3_02380 [Pectobacterium actinidiae]
MMNDFLWNLGGGIGFYYYPCSMCWLMRINCWEQFMTKKSLRRSYVAHIA